MCTGLCPFILETETYQGGPQCGPQCGPWASAGPLPAPEAFPLSRTSAFNGRMAIVPSGKRGLRPLVLSCILFLVPKSHGAATKAAAQMRACQPPRFSLPHPPEPAGSACLLPATAGRLPVEKAPPRPPPSDSPGGSASLPTFMLCPRTEYEKTQ